MEIFRTKFTLMLTMLQKADQTTARVYITLKIKRIDKKLTIFTLQAPVSGRQSGHESGGGLAPTSLFRSGVLLVDLSAFLFTSLSSSQFTCELGDYDWVFTGGLTRVHITAEGPRSEKINKLQMIVVKHPELIQYLSLPQSGRSKLIDYALKGSFTLSVERPPGPFKDAAFEDGSKAGIYLDDRIRNVDTGCVLELHPLNRNTLIWENKLQKTQTTTHVGDVKAKVDQLKLGGERPDHAHVKKLEKLIAIMRYKVIQTIRCCLYESEIYFTIQHMYVLELDVESPLQAPGLT